MDELSTQVTTTIEEVVEESTSQILLSFPGEGGRKNELHAAITQDTKRLFGQIEQGLTLHFRTNTEKVTSGDKQLALEMINRINRRLDYPEPEPEPMLLSPGEILEGEIIIKRTSRKTTAVSKKV